MARRWSILCGRPPFRAVLGQGHFGRPTEFHLPSSNSGHQEVFIFFLNIPLLLGGEFTPKHGTENLDPGQEFKQL